MVVTGGTAGVGRATVRAFAAEGARIGVIARDQDRLEQTMAELQGAGATGLGVAADVADAKEVDRAAEAFERDLGPIDIWVNNAMTSIFAPFIEIEPEEFKRVTEVTYLGFVYGTYAALSRMVPRDRGVIVQVGSALTERAIPLQSAYCGAKHAVQGFTESVRCELLHDHSRVRIGLVQLPALNTPHFDWALSRLPRRAQPVPPIYQPEIAARGIVQFAKHNRRESFGSDGQRPAPSLRIESSPESSIDTSGATGTTASKPKHLSSRTDRTTFGGPSRRTSTRTDASTTAQDAAAQHFGRACTDACSSSSPPPPPSHSSPQVCGSSRNPTPHHPKVVGPNPTPATIAPGQEPGSGGASLVLEDRSFAPYKSAKLAGASRSGCQSQCG